jgi:predicted nuclease of predicted toxin-antitoxin system
MTARLRFHLDENVDPAVADGLRRRGVDVTTTFEVDLVQASDEKQLEYAESERRVIVTHDSDFLRMAGRVGHPGIAYSAQESRTVGQLIAALFLLWECLSSDDMRSHVEFL